MWYKEDKFIIKIGSNTYENVPNLIVYKGENIFTIYRAESTEIIGIDFEIYNSKGEKVATVRQGRIYSGVKENYEIIFNQYEYLLIEKESGRVICEIKKRIKTDIFELEVNVSLYTKDGFLINATPEKTNLGGIQMRECHFANLNSAIVFG